jgi:hypothetical protein
MYEEEMKLVKCVQPSSSQDHPQHDGRTTLDAIFFMGETDAAPMQLETYSSIQELQSQAADAGTWPKTTATVLRRAHLWLQLSHLYETDGALVPALHAASEAHRIVSNAAAKAAPEGRDVEVDAVGEGWWRLAACRLRCLVQLGALFEATGLAEEAAQSLYEGQSLVSTCPIYCIHPRQCASMYL